LLRYEVQILDSYPLFSIRRPGSGRPVPIPTNPTEEECSAVYKVAAPLANAWKAPTIWQSYDIG
jgi:hypothetical protein